MEPTEELTPEKLFEKRWAMTILEHVFEQLSAEFAEAGKSEQFEQLRAYLTDARPQIPYKQAAEALGVSEAAVKVKVHRLRRRFGELLHAEIAQTVTSSDLVEGEIKSLLSGLV
jgi:RNA polymerase sigma-70 factor (ECF subfamily)